MDYKSKSISTQSCQTKLSLLIHIIGEVIDVSFENKWVEELQNHQRWIRAKKNRYNKLLKVYRTKAKFFEITLHLKGFRSSYQ